MEREYSTKGVIRDIISMQKFLQDFKFLGKDYNEFMVCLINTSELLEMKSILFYFIGFSNFCFFFFAILSSFVAHKSQE